MGMRKLSQYWASHKLSSVKAVCRVQVLSQPVVSSEAGGLHVSVIHTES